MTFSAEFYGSCAACFEAVTPGQEVEYNTLNRLVHVYCPEQAPEPAKAVCPGCFLEIPANGVCGLCDD